MQTVAKSPKDMFQEFREKVMLWQDLIDFSCSTAAPCADDGQNGILLLSRCTKCSRVHLQSVAHKCAGSKRHLKRKAEHCDLDRVCGVSVPSGVCLRPLNCRVHSMQAKALVHRSVPFLSLLRRNTEPDPPPLPSYTLSVHIDERRTGVEKVAYRTLVTRQRMRHVLLAVLNRQQQ